MRIKRKAVRTWATNRSGLIVLASVFILMAGSLSVSACASEIVSGSYYAVDADAFGVCVNLNTHCNESRAKGAPDGDFVSLGGEGHIIVELDEPVTDGPGTDLRVYEMGGAGNVDAEGFDVYISESGIGWIKVADCVFNDAGKSYASISLSGHTGSYGYVKIVDCWTEPWTGSTTGADIDAVQGLHTLVTIVDDTPPVLICPGDVTIEKGEPDSAVVTGQASATDAIDSSPTVAYLDSREGSCPEVIHRTWIAEDHCGNSVSCIQIITVEDTVAPVLSCPSNQTIEKGESEAPANTGWATATDAGGTSPSVSFSDSRSGRCPEVITRTWVAEDDCGNSSSRIQIITVEDTVAPVLSCPSNRTIEKGESEAPANTGRATAIDAGDTSPSVSFSDSRSGRCPEVITRTWVAEDDCGNSSSRIQIITVEDTVAPVLSCPSNRTIEQGESEAPANTGRATAIDAGDTFPTVTYSDSRSGTDPEVITRTWKAQDKCGNSALCVQTITINASRILTPVAVVVAGGFYAIDVRETGVCANSNSHCDPSEAEGAPDGNHVSLGGTGSIIVRLQKPVVDGSGEDLRVYEVGDVVGADDEGFDVYVSTDGSSWIKIGSCVSNEPGKSYASLDLSGHSEAYQYVKVVDCWTDPWVGSTTGADIDAVQGLYTVLTLLSGNFHAVDVVETGVCANSNTHCDPGEAEGAPDGGHVSLGGTGYIIARLEAPVVDGPGADLRIYEVGDAVGADDEGFDVYVRTDGSGWIQIGVRVSNDPGKSYASLDLAGHSEAYEYVKIVDCWTDPWIGSTTGADIDAIQGLYTDAEAP